jgi:O-antigen/teichoic acid export membrane protein
MGKFWMMLLNLIITPYVLHKLGTQLFGVWSLVFVIANYMNLLDLGLGTSFAKYIAEYHAKGELKLVNSVVSCGLLFYLGLSVIIVALGFALKNPIASLLNIPPAIREESSFAIVGMIIVLAMKNGFSIFQGLLVGLQRMDIQNKILVFASTANLLGTIFFLEKGYGIRGLVVNSGLVAALIILCNIFFSHRLVPQLRIGLKWLHREVFLKLFRFGVKAQLSNLSSLVHFQADKIIISHFLGLNYVAFYELGQKVANALRMFPGILLTALEPAVSELHARGERDRLLSLYYRGSKYVSVLVFPLTFLTFILASGIMRVWVGEGYSLSAITLQVLIIEYGLNLLTGVGTRIVRGIGRPELETKYKVLVAVSHLILSLTLIQLLGFKGVLLSFLLSGSIGSIYFIRIFHGFFKERLKTLLRLVYLKPMAVSLAAALTSFLLTIVLSSLFADLGSFKYLFMLLTNVFIFGAIFVTTMVKMKYFKGQEMQFLLDSFKKV